VAVVEVSGEPRVDYLKAALGLLPGRRGADLPDVELVRRGVAVHRGHLAAYDRVCGFRLSDTLPATYPHVLAFPLAMRLMSAGDFPFPVVGLVHVANRITVRKAVRADDELDLAVRVADLRPHARGRQFDVVTTATVAGEQVWTGVATYLSKDRSGDGGAPREHSPAPTSAPVSSWRVPARVGTDYAAVSGDRNPIHTSRIGARLFGFPRPIAHGMWSKARCLAALEGRLPDTYTVDVAFKAPILLPGRIGFAARRTAQGWEFSLAGRRPHLAGEVTGP
jgi:acyl dehydratase